MAEIGKAKQRLTIRIGRSTMAMLVSSDDGEEVVFEPYVVKSGVSMAANLREAFKSSDLLLQAPPRVRVMIDSDVLLVPVELFDEASMEQLHRHAFPRQEQDVVAYNVLPELNAVAVFAVNKDLKLVLDDHFRDVRLVEALQPVWRHLHQRSFTGASRKLYGYFHEKRLELFSFHKNRFRFFNSFDAGRSKDAVYYISYVWRQQNMDASADELHLVGDIPDEAEVLEELRCFLKKVMVINPSADFSGHPALDAKDMPYDLLTMVVKGRG